MSTAMGPMRDMAWFQNILVHIDDSAWVGVGVGTLLTLLIQSSAATIAILQNLYADAALNLNGALPVLFGDNIGTAITTAALAMVGSNIAAKRVAASHVLFNVIGTIICLIALVPYTAFVSYLETTFGLNPKMTIATAHGTFNILNTVLQFPFIWLLVIVVTRLIPGEDEQIKYSTQYLDKSLISSAPAVALGQVQKEFIEMLILSKKSLRNSVEYFMTRDESLNEKGETYEEAINNFVSHIHCHIRSNNPILQNKNFLKYRLPLFTLDGNQRFNYSLRQWQLIGQYDPKNDNKPMTQIFPELAEELNKMRVIGSKNV